MRLYNFLLATALLFAGCSADPEPIVFGKDACEHCKMTIMDQKYGAEIVSHTGKVIKFDATECMVSFMKASPGYLDTAKNTYLIINFSKPETLIDAKTAYFLHDDQYKSPMGGNLAAFPSKDLAENNRLSDKGRVLSWKELLLN